MNIVFLDIDGVLNSINNLIRVYNETHKPHSGYSYPFDYNCLENLRELVIKSGSYIVITSTWRKSKEGIKKIFEVLSMYQLDQFVIGVTPNLGLSRGEEIKKYLSYIETNVNFVILDDDNDMGDLSQYLVKTNIINGLTKENVEQALNILKVDNKILKK